MYISHGLFGNVLRLCNTDSIVTQNIAPKIDFAALLASNLFTKNSFRSEIWGKRGRSKLHIFGTNRFYYQFQIIELIITKSSVS